MDGLAFLEPPGTPLFRTHECGAVRLRWMADSLCIDSYVGYHAIRLRSDAPPSWPAPIPTAPTAIVGWVRGIVALTGFVAGLGGCFVVAVVEFGAWALVRSGGRQPASAAAPWEEIRVRTGDGVSLAGTWRRAPGATGRTVLLLHGFGEDRTVMLGRAELLLERGWNVALLDARGRGRSGNAWSTFGTRESGDIASWLDELSRRVGPGFEATAWGRSMGATIALRAAAGDHRLRALVLEAPYPRLRDCLARWLRARKVFPPLAGAILRRARAIAGCELDHPPLEEAARSTRVPVLILHGSKDQISPPSDVQRLAAALPRTPRVIQVPGARHGDIYETGGADLARKIAEFLTAALASI
jgi:pimeloyl-ACP methyl ester carboxylesterase